MPVKQHGCAGPDRRGGEINYCLISGTRTSSDASQVASIHDPLASDGEARNVSLLVYNTSLVAKYDKITRSIADRGDKKTLQQMSELHLCVMCKSAMEGAGILRISEAVSALYSSPNQHARRTIYWEDGRMTVAYDWSKVSGEHLVGICHPEVDTD
jgi:hypothetical protein